tara:strand:+ start:265 stop:549 length:285 start_codon:yes stop_codon:yes gene_type:complete
MLNDNQKKSDWADREMGAFWTQDGKNGKFLTGYVELDELGIKRKTRVVMFPNRHKINEKAPDYKLYISKDKPVADMDEQKKASTGNDELPESLV